MTIDGFVCGPNGELDWMIWNQTDDIKKYVTALTDSIDTILLGRKMTDDFINYWESVKPEDPAYPFARKMVETPKVVFSKTLTESKWANTVVATGDLTEEVNKLKNQDGKDIIVYGGAGFNTALIKANLIDEYYLTVNPAAIGKGRSIFAGLEATRSFTLAESIRFDSGEVLLKYLPNR